MAMPKPWEESIGEILNAVLDGSVGVFPTHSMITYCNTNASGIFDEVIGLTEYIQKNKWNDAAKSAKFLLKHFHSTVFYCFYTVTDTGKAAQYQKPFNLVTISWNILFNLGYIYTNIKDIIYLFYYELPKDQTVDERSWSTFGKSVGDLITRFIYSKYITNPRFKSF